MSRPDEELRFDLKPSKQFMILLSFMIFGSIAIICYIEIAAWIKISLFIFTICYGTFIFVRDGLLKHQRSILQLKISRNEYKLKDQKSTYSAELSGDSTLTSIICILRFKVHGQILKRSCIIFKDSLENDAFRRLFVALKIMHKQQ